MHYHVSSRIELDTAQLAALARRFEALNDAAGLARLLCVPEQTLLKLAAKPNYYTFFIPKPGGEKRLIQHPAAALKTVQQDLNRFLQAVYFGVKPDCAYGFIIRPTDELRPRNIYFNAMAHHKNEWFLVVDLKDFFHTVTTTHLRDLFRLTFCFPPELTALLTNLCAFNGRLPMGAPTSPVLSNFACLFLDYQLEKLAAEANAVYTRYADDITFSFREMPAPSFLEQVRLVILQHGFVVNEKK